MRIDIEAASNFIPTGPAKCFASKPHIDLGSLVTHTKIPPCVKTGGNRSTHPRDAEGSDGSCDFDSSLVTASEPSASAVMNVRNINYAELMDVAAK